MGVLTQDNEHFSIDAYLASCDSVLLSTGAGRKILTRLDPLLFAIVYLRRHITDADGEVTLADFHLDLIQRAKEWIRPTVGPVGPRDAFIAPRDSGKSTWLFLILVLWAASHEHIHFAAAFADSADQSEGHLSTLRNELNSNVLLRADFPDLCSPQRRPGGMTVSDRQNALFTKSGFVFAARGIDSGVLGLKVGDMRPDLLILDDIEPGESKYSATLMEKRLRTLVDVILPLSATARVVLSGTVTMAGSIIHQLAKAARGEDEPPAWIKDEGFTAHFYPPIIIRDDGTERSCWPARWPVEFLQSIRHTRSFAKNFANSPMGSDGGYWDLSDFMYGPLDTVTRWLMSIDPAVTTSAGSDYTGISVVGYSPTADRVLVRYAEQVRLGGAALRGHVLTLLRAFPEVKVALVETNQGGDLWKDVFHDMPIRFIHLTQSVKKEVRAAQVLAFYQRGKVQHEVRLPGVEEQMVAFPKGSNDDMVDAVGTAVLRFLKPKPQKHTALSSGSYV